MKSKINSVLKEVLKKVEPPKEDIKIIKDSLETFLDKFEKEKRKLNIKAEIFIGGSFAKDTIIKKDYYDIDVFVRFEKQYKEISKLTEKILKKIGKFSLIHGSRDYFKIKGTKVPLINSSFKIGAKPDKISSDFFIEIIPVKKIKSPKEAENITDLSYSHVRYIKRKVKSEKLLDEIKLAKVFCYANHCYGAESYINGFSGYALELLIYYYNGFINFVKNISKIKEQTIIDIEKDYKNKQEILMNLNNSKLKSPIILIDPTYKQRNALAALSKETFENFKKICKEFLKNPGTEYFEIKKIELENLKKDAKKKKFEYILLKTKTNKQEGDIAGSKLLKFYNHLNKEINVFFEIKDKGFSYSGEKYAKYFFVVKPKKEILIKGPKIKEKKHTKRFEKIHKSYFIKNSRIYSKEKINFDLKKFIENWKKKHKRKLKDMSIKKLEILDY